MIKLKKALLLLSTLTLFASCDIGKPDTPEDIADFEPLEVVERDWSALDGYDPNLIWEDNFDTLDKKAFNIRTEEGWKPSKRKHYYLPRNVKVSEGNLEIEIKKEEYKGYPYTSGAVTTQGKVDILYGRLEVRAKLPEGKGLLPAIWILPIDDTEFPEIDIAEIIGQEPNRLWSVLHWKENGKQKRDFTYTDTKKPLTDDFHVYGLIWTKDKLSWTLDGKVVFETTKKIPDVPMYLYINTAVGGVWVTDPEEGQEFPKKMLIDYVRYYKN